MARNLQHEHRLVIITMLSRRDGWFCHYCGVYLERWMKTRPQDVVIEHKSPDIALRTDPDNLTLACIFCNTDKGNTPYADYMARIEERPSYEDGERIYPSFKPLTPFEKTILEFIMLRQPE